MNDIALILAGVIGAAVAVIHGVLLQKLMVRPMRATLTEHGKYSAALLRLFPALLHFSTFCWLLSGLALIAAALWFSPEARLVTCLGVAVPYGYGVVFNCWATRGRHPGWILLAIALALIWVGAVQPSRLSAHSRTHPSVIPAKTGISCGERCAHLLEIPAFAGMTVIHLAHGRCRNETNLLASICA